jgi:acyl-CoA reductase-like NAD-dependent aldehyde dehydrogenase
MAASVLLLVGGPHADADGNSDGADTNSDSVGVARLQEKLIQKVVEKAKGIGKGLGPGQIGPVIDQASFEKIHKYIREAEQSGAEILLDGRSWDCEEGHWVGPTIIKHASKDDSAMKEEIFGPVLSVYTASSWTEAIEIENSNPFGNAACIYTSNGGYAEWFTRRFRAAMLGVNVGIPVPREPFSFGGLYGTCSKYGDMDITGDGAMEFFSNRIKITTKWIVPKIDEPSITNGPVDQANFAGTM